MENRSQMRKMANRHFVLNAQAVCVFTSRLVEELKMRFVRILGLGSALALLPALAAAQDEADHP
ncbi:MAG TPA: hypothetical protein DEP13_08960, partial [Gammaproteobacteria bacterium]|nr:hypothetical protein [Gammaproteobacteria bacterium]